MVQLLWIHNNSEWPRSEFGLQACASGHAPGEDALLREVSAVCSWCVPVQRCMESRSCLNGSRSGEQTGRSIGSAQSSGRTSHVRQKEPSVQSSGVWSDPGSEDRSLHPAAVMVAVCACPSSSGHHHESASVWAEVKDDRLRAEVWWFYFSCITLSGVGCSTSRLNVINLNLCWFSYLNLVTNAAQ